MTPTYGGTFGNEYLNGDPDGSERTIPLPPKGDPDSPDRTIPAQHNGRGRTEDRAARRPEAEPAPRALTGLRDGRLKRILGYPVLYAMAAADAFGFWNTLSQVIKRDSTLVLVFVMALAIAAVAAPHQVGRILRSRLEGYGGSLSWLGVLSTLWLALGITIASLRWNTPTRTAGRRTGRLAVADAAGDHRAAMYLAVLLLVLFLLTGALAMTHGYRYGDPRTPEIKAAQKERLKIIKDLPNYRREVANAEGRLAANVQLQELVEQSRQRSHEIDADVANQLRNQSRNEIARHVGDPSGTDELLTDFSEIPLRPRASREPYREPPEI